ncbi:MAG: hypothetical protein GXP55_17540 [Deltaproteobacteria bacterium]|nr:hypothetical protein [Deltaproteobacteria bacterium]
MYANAGRWEFLDFMGGTRPRLLVGVENGLGATTTMTYDSAAADCAEAEPACERFTWSDAQATGCDARYAVRDELFEPIVPTAAA